MADIQTNIIQSLSKVIESAQTAYGPSGLGARAQVASSAQPVVLSVIAARDNQLVLQDQASGKRIVLDKEALQGLVPTNLNKGDKLTLLSTNKEVATFSVEKAPVAATPVKSSALGQVYSQTLAQKLSAQWPEISPSVLRKISPNILNQISFEGNSQSALSAAKSLIEIANKANQPLLAIKLEASVKQVSGNSVQLAINTNNNGQVKTPVLLTLPVNNELNAKLALGKTITIEFNANDLRNLIQKISLNNKESVSKQTIHVVNKALSNGNEQLKHLLAQVLFSNKNSKASDLVFAPTKDNLQSLNTSIKQALTANVIPSELKDARLIAAQGNSANNSNTNVQLSLVAKPSLLNIDALQLAQASSKVNLQSIFDNADNMNSSNSQKTQVDLSQSALSRNNSSVQQLSQSIGASPEVAVGSTQLDSLRSKLISLLNEPTKSNNTATPAETNRTIASLQTVINDEMNQTLPKSESISKVLPSLLSQLEHLKSRSGSELKPLFQSVISQINEAQQLDDGADTSDSDADLLQQSSAARIKEVFTQQALPNITSQNFLAQAIQPILGSTPQGSLVNGLVTMLQASLQARLIAQQPNLLATIAQMSPAIAQVLGSKSTKANPTIGKALQDLNKLDPRGNLISELNKVLSNHSLHKLSAAESTLQGQDSFYYALPNPFSAHHKDIEILIKREKRYENENTKKEAQQHWQLSMKLDIGDSGDVLAKVKLFQNQLDLNLYASNQTLKNKILDFLPYLNRRLVAAGLQVKPQCFLGKIPEQLYKTDYQVVQAYV